MGISDKVADHPGEVDVIIAGGGTAGCILAGRLAEAEPSLSILVVEGGRNNLDDPTVVNPAVFLSHLAPDSKNATFYKGRKSDKLAGREPIVPTGGILGGGSSINFMMYTRAQGVDFDSFNTEGWAQNDVLPLLRKLETFHDKNSAIDKSVHGYDGPINVSDGGFRCSRVEDELLKVSESQGYPEIVDLQDLQQVNGFSRWQRYVCPNGKRQDTAHRYLHPRLQDGKHPNLHVLTETKVDRVLFDNKTAIGVVVVPHEAHQPQTALSQQPAKSFKARKLVVVASGALGTPQILERSGVGNKSLLEKLDIPVVAALPGVGDAYQDHHLCLYPYKTSLKPEETNDALLGGRVDFSQAVKEKNPMLGWNSIDLASKLRPTDAEVVALGKEFKGAWDRDYGSSPTRPLMLMGVVASFLGDPSLVPVGQYITAGCYTAYPYSRGSIHITSKDANSAPDFETGFLNDKDDLDLKAQVWAYKRQREIVRRLSTYRGELDMGHPKFASNSAAALVSYDDVDGLDPASTAERIKLPPLEYTAADDAAIENCIRENLNTTWHSLGTCAMRDVKDGGVVDKNLNVHGVRGLKLCDLSVIPENVGANTNNTALLVGEKAAEIVIRELGLAA